MVDRVKAAVDAKTDPDFFLIARTDAFQNEGADGAIDRLVACAEAGADGVFADAVVDIATYKRMVEATKVPVLCNITEFGKTPFFTVDECRDAGIGMILYPLSAFRAMNKAAENVYKAIRRDGTQKNVVDTMQTREELYEVINYHAYEQSLDKLFAAKK
jgi:methylisocitrate lyase